MPPHYSENRPHAEIRAELREAENRFFLRRSLESRTSLHPVGLGSLSALRVDQSQQPPRRTNPTRGARLNPGSLDRANPISPPVHPTSPDRTKPRFRFVQQRSASCWSPGVAPIEPNAGRPRRRSKPTTPYPRRSRYEPICRRVRSCGGSRGRRPLYT
jgi:hypothetical protein